MKLPLLRWQMRLFRRSARAIPAGAALTGLVIAVALLLGDSLQAWHLHLQTLRIGRLRSALDGGDRFFRAEAADRLAPHTVAPLLQVHGAIEAPDHAAYAVDARILGVDARFWRFSPGGRPPVGFERQGVYINTLLAQRLNVDIGDDILIRADAEPAGLAEMQLRFAPASPKILRRKVSGLLTPDQFSRFNLHQDDRALPLLILPLADAQSFLQQPHKANLLLSDSPDLPDLNARFRTGFSLEDAEARVEAVLEMDEWEIRSRRVFLEPPIGRAAAQAGLQAEGILAYFVNGITASSHTVPYSLVAALPPSRLTVDLADHQILIHPWLADDLSIGPGDPLTLRYFIPTPDRRLAETQAVFTVHSILPESSPLLDPGLVPDFPGLRQVDQCSEWSPDFPIDLQLVRPQDEAYWTRYRATPKAILTLAAGQALWSNTFGNLTAIRFHVSAAESESALDAAIARRIDPRDLELAWTAIQSAPPRFAQDFRSLFLGLSIFLILAALALTALAWNLELTRRIPSIGLWRAAGFSPGRILRLLLAELSIGVAAGALAGLLLGAILVAVGLHRLEALFPAAPDTPLPRLVFHWSLPIKVIGATWLGALLCTGFRLRALCRQPVADLLRGSFAPAVTAKPSAIRTALLGGLALLLLAGAGGLGHLARSARPEDLPLLALGSGAAALAGGLLAIAAALFRPIRRNLARRPGLLALAQRQIARFPARSLTVIGIAAAGLFLIMAVQVFHRDPLARADRRDSATGGFSILAEAYPPQHRLVRDVRDKRWEALLPDLARARLLALRWRPGDDASCRSALRSLRPPLLGVPSASLHELHAFSLRRVLPGLARTEGWRLLQSPLPDGALPAFGDTTTLAWGLHLALGDTLVINDDQGRPLRLRIIGELGDSLFQGSLLLDEARFLQAFPTDPGPRRFLIESPADTALEAVAQLNREYGAEGLRAERTVDRLAALYAVEARYLALFGLLGATGLFFGAAALGLILVQQARNRRAEMGILRACGWSPGFIARMLLVEYAGLLAAGILLGALAGAWAAWPWLLRQAQGPSVEWIAAGLLALLATGLAGLGLAAFRAARLPVVTAIRDEE